MLPIPLHGLLYVSVKYIVSTLLFSFIIVSYIIGSRLGTLCAFKDHSSTFSFCVYIRICDVYSQLCGVRDVLSLYVLLVDLGIRSIE